MIQKAKDPHGGPTLAHASIYHFPVFYKAHKVTQSLIEIGYMTLCEREGVHTCRLERLYDHTKTGHIDI